MNTNTIYPHPIALALTLSMSLSLSLIVGACGADDSGPASQDPSFSDVGGWQEPTPPAQPDAGPTEPGSPTEPTDPNPGPDPAPDPAPTPPPPPPEQERDFDLRTPESGDTRLYIPSAGLDALVVVDAVDLGVELVEVGSGPSLVRAFPGDAGAIVLNSESSDVSIVRPAEFGGYEVLTMDVIPHHNRLALTPDGTWAFAWYEPTSGDPIGALQDVSAIRCLPGQEVVYNLVVGYRPEQVFFAKGSEVALFLTEEGISGAVLALLDGDAKLPPVPLHDNPFIKPKDREVVVTPDAQYAVVRDLEAPELTLVDLQANERWVLPLADWPSDIDMTPTGDTVVVPMPNSEQVAVVEVPDAFFWEPPPPVEPDPLEPDAEPTETPNPHVITSYTGSHFGAAELDGAGVTALLYTTLSGTLAVGLLDVETGKVLSRPIPKEVTAAAVAENGSMAVLFHRANSGLEPPALGSEGYSLLDLESGFFKLVLTDNAPSALVFASDPETGFEEVYVSLPDPWSANHAVHRVGTISFAVDVYPTPDAPVFVGVLDAAGKAAVMLDDPTGWITLIDTGTGDIDQVNSFELNSFIQ